MHHRRWWASLPLLGIWETVQIDEVDRDLTSRQFGIDEPLVLTAHLRE